jgi:hypothetical protein
MLNTYCDFRLQIHQVNRGMRIDLENAPGCAFVDGRMIHGIRELLSAVVRDIVYFHTEIQPNPYFDLDRSEGITNTVFEILRNHRLEHARQVLESPNHVVSDDGLALMNSKRSRRVVRHCSTSGVRAGAHIWNLSNSSTIVMPPPKPPSTALCTSGT